MSPKSIAIVSQDRNSFPQRSYKQNQLLRWTVNLLVINRHVKSQNKPVGDTALSSGQKFYMPIPGLKFYVAISIKPSKIRMGNRMITVTIHRNAKAQNILYCLRKKKG